MGGHGSGRTPNVENLIKRQSEKLTPIGASGDSLFLPNLSGVQDAAKKGAINPLTASKIVVTDANKNLISGTNTDAEVLTAYTHSQDNSQAHSDYLLNTADTATGSYTFNRDSEGEESITIRNNGAGSDSAAL